jgi:hypothetical protein
MNAGYGGGSRPEAQAANSETLVSPIRIRNFFIGHLRIACRQQEKSRPEIWAA